MQVFVIFLVLLFGQGSWIGINSIWVELPLLVSLGIPEQFEIASWLVIIIQVANIGPLLFAVINYMAPKGYQLEGPTNYLISAVGTATCVFLIFYWDVFTIWKLDNQLHSTYFTIFVFLLALVDCTSNVTFPPFMARLKSQYMNWFFIGMGLSGMIPSLVAIIQGVGGAPVCVANYTYNDYDDSGELRQCTSWTHETKPARFGPEVFFSFLSVMMLSCFVAFVCLNHLPSVRREYAPEYLNQQREASSDAGGNQRQRQYEMVSSKKDEDDEIEVSSVLSQPRQSSSILEFVALFVILGVANALVNCVLPSIQSYSAGAYGLNIYLLAATFGNIANPLACFVVMLKPSRSFVLVITVFALGTVAGIYCFVTALTSPLPPLQDSVMGSILVVSR